MCSRLSDRAEPPDPPRTSAQFTTPTIGQRNFSWGLCLSAVKNHIVAHQLLVVVPVDDKKKCLQPLLCEWIAELESAGIDYGVVLLDDGACPVIGGILESLVRERGDDRIQRSRQHKTGHGQMCLEGYRLACWNHARWVLQIDAGGRCDPAFFRAMWDRRHDYEVVYGHRTERLDGWTRRLSGALLRGLVRMTAGVDCPDANVPYRLMSTNGLLPVVETVPTGFNFANVALAVQLKRAGWREASVPIVFRRASGPPTAVPLARSLGQALELCGQLLLLPRPVLRQTH
jgi:hypothetical protein